MSRSLLDSIDNRMILVKSIPDLPYGLRAEQVFPIKTRDSLTHPGTKTRGVIMCLAACQSHCRVRDISFKGTMQLLNSFASYFFLAAPGSLPIQIAQL